VVGFYYARCLADQMKTGSPSASFRVAAKLENLAAIRRFVEEASIALGVEPATVTEIVLAVDEAAANIILHGYRGQSGPIAIQVKCRPAALVICLRDKASPFDPTSVPAINLTAPPEERTASGLGVHLIRKIMDEVTHSVTPQGGNQLILVKKLEANSEDLDIDN
jgi:serine/threonine-protein kinase RsbW